MTMPKLSVPVLIGLAAVAYFFFSKKGAAATASATTPPLSSPAGGGGDLIDLGVKAGGELLKFGGAVAKEVTGTDGMAPSSLNGHVASLGGYGELGGTFYGSH
jgi:hypothetical protein